MPRPRSIAQILRRSGLLALVGFLLCVSAAGFVEFRGREIVPREDAPATDVAIVFGAGITPPGEPTPVLAERLDAAIWLLRHGKVKQLLLSGNSDRHHDEVRAMKRYALAHGVPAAALLEDPQGESTYATCSRARQVFGLSRALLVTQRYHLPRAVFIARSLGIDAVGVAADETRERADSWFSWRELLSRPWALVEVYAKVAPPPARSRTGNTNGR